MTAIPDHSPFTSQFRGEGPTTGVVLSHGFTGSPHALRDWAAALADAGFAVRMPLLPGHGTTWPDLARTHWRQWHDALDSAYLDLDAECGQVFTAGLSMGGALALRLAATRPVAGVVLVNPALLIDDRRAVISGLLKYVLRSTPAIANDILKAGVEEGAYPRTPVSAAHQLNLMFKDTVRLLPRVTAPVHVFRSTRDHVVSDASLNLLRRRLSGTSLDVSYLENSYHVATLDNDASSIFTGSVDFIRRQCATGPAPNVRKARQNERTGSRIT